MNEPINNATQLASKLTSQELILAVVVLLIFLAFLGRWKTHIHVFIQTRRCHKRIGDRNKSTKRIVVSYIKSARRRSYNDTKKSRLDCGDSAMPEFNEAKQCYVSAGTSEFINGIEIPSYREGSIMNAIDQVKRWWRHMKGDWIDDIIHDVKNEGEKTRTHINDVYNRATLDGEDYWLIRNKSTVKRNEEIRNDEQAI